MTSTDVPALLLTGPPRHGVARYARDVAEQVRRLDPRTHVIDVDSPRELVDVAAGYERVHLHVTDRIFGDSPAEAADLLERVAGCTRLTVTLHDVPQPSDGVVNLPRRSSAYGRVVAAATGVVVNSDHEAHLLTEHGVIPARWPVQVIPLGSTPSRQALVDDTRSGANTPGEALVALVAGYMYPGKGHDDVVRATATAAARLRGAGFPLTEAAVVAIGGPSSGHEGDVIRLRTEAAELGVELRVTGSLDDEGFRCGLRADGIPVAAHQHLSASRTLLDWGEQGRRPLVVDSNYAREMAALRPDTLTLYQSGHLDRFLEAAWHDPRSTRLRWDVDLRPTLADVALAYRSWWSAGETR